MDQAIILVYLIIALVFVFLSSGFKDKKEKEYKNDERWQLVKQKASKITLKYFDLLLVLICLGAFYYDLWDSQSIITLKRVFQYGFYIIMLRNPIEYFAFRYYDRTI